MPFEGWESISLRHPTSQSGRGPTYEELLCFGFTYCFLGGNENARPETLRALKYRIDEHTGILGIHLGEGTYLPCIPESKVLGVLQNVHDYGSH